MNEEWRVIEMAPKYKISNLGNVMGPRGILKPMPGRKGYLRACMHCEQGKKYATVHSLVLSAFVGPRPDGFHGCHINGNNTDNRLVNLKWASVSENYEDQRIHGTNAHGERHGISKLTVKDVAEIRAKFAADGHKKHWGSESLAKKFGVNRTTIQRAAHGVRWKSINENSHQGDLNG